MSENFELMVLQSKLNDLGKQQAAIADQVHEIKRQMEAIRLAAYPHKVGDVIDYHGRPAKIVQINAYTADVYPTVVKKLPSGGWSKREHIMIDWSRWT